MGKKPITRRSCFKIAMAAGLSAGAGGVLFSDQIDRLLHAALKNSIDFRYHLNDSKDYNALYPVALDTENRIHHGDLPLYTASSSDALALTRFFPHLVYAKNNRAKVQIMNIHHEDFADVHDSLGKRAVVHNSCFPVASKPGQYIIPWTPLFARQTPVKLLKHPEFTVLNHQGVYIKDEGSDSVALFGNKARKYEFSFPFCLQSGARSIVTFGSLSSNHCVFTALTAACAQLGSSFNVPDPQVLVNLYPQRLYPHIVDKLQYLLALGAGIRFVNDDMQVAFSILSNRARERYSPDDDLGYCEPGGSNPLTTLSHINALFELNEQISDGLSGLDAPPDYIYVPLGSGGTCMGLVLGCYLLGWKTKVVGTTSQGKAAWKRALVFGNPTRPFLVQNGARLLKKTIDVLKFLDLPGHVMNNLDPATILRHHFLYDNTTWKPAYGIASAKTQAVIEQFSDEGLLALDTTFSGKSLTTLMDHLREGRLKGKAVLFWNTHQRFDFMACPKVRNADLSLLPEGLRQYLQLNTIS